MSSTVTVNTCTKYCSEECPYFEIECNTFYSDMLGHKFYSCSHLDACKKALSFKEKEEQEEPKSYAEAFIDSLLETLVLRSKNIELSGMFGMSERSKGYVDGEKAMIKNVIKIIKEYKEKADD